MGVCSSTDLQNEGCTCHPRRCCYSQRSPSHIHRWSIPLQFLWLFNLHQRRCFSSDLLPSTILLPIGILQLRCPSDLCCCTSRSSRICCPDPGIYPHRSTSSW